MKRNAQMAELVDAQVSGICAARRGGSSPLLGTIPKNITRCFRMVLQLAFVQAYGNQPEFKGSAKYGY